MALVTCKELEIYAIGNAAILLGPPGLTDSPRDTKQKLWVPDSLIDSKTASEIGDIGDFEMEKWVAEQRGLDYE